MSDQVVGTEQVQEQPVLSPQERILAMLNEEEKRRPLEEADDPSQVAQEDPEVDLESDEEDFNLEDEDPEEDNLEEGEDDIDLEGDDDTEPDLHTVKVDGEEVEVEYDELLKGYSRQAHFTRAMQALREEEAAFQQHQQAVVQERQQYQVLLTQLHQVLTTQSSGRTAEQWAELKATDPVGYTLAREEERDRQEKIRAVEMELQTTQQKQTEQQKQEMARIQAEEQQKLVAAIPAWQDQKVAQEELEAMGRYALGLGFTEEDLGAIIDHRTLLVLRDAAKYASLKNKKASLKPENRSTKPATPGRSKRPRPQRNKEATASRQRLKETGSVQDAAKAIAHYL